MANRKTDRSTADADVPRTNSDVTASNIKSSPTKDRVYVKTHEFNPSPGKILLPSTVGIPPRDGSPESRLRDPRILWAPAISISGKTDQPLITPQYEKRQQRIADKSEQVKQNPKTATNADLSYLTRLGNDRTQLPISFLPHNITPSKRPLTIAQRGPGPASYQQYKNYDQVGEEYIYRRQPHVRIQPLIGPMLKRGADEKSSDIRTKAVSDTKQFWATIGTRTYDSRLPNAPVSAIHHRLHATLGSEDKNKQQAMSLPGPAAYPIINAKNEGLGRETCGFRGVTIAPRYPEKRVASSRPGPAMIEREALDKGYQNLLRKAPAFSMSSRWSPYSHTYTDECSANLF